MKDPSFGPKCFVNAKGNQGNNSSGQWYQDLSGRPWEQPAASTQVETSDKESSSAEQKESTD